jgi:hypothetical protein
MTTTRTLAIFTALFAAATANAEKNPWSATFGAEAAGTYLDGNPRVLVAGVGEGAEVPLAADALRAALRASKRARLVIDDSALGDLNRQKDSGVVKMAAGQPVDVIAVLRIFGGEKDTAVATFYDKKGGTLGALSVEKGAALAARSEDRGGGVSQRTESAVSRVLHGEDDKKEGDKTPADPKEAEYERRHVGFYTHVTINLLSGQAWGQWGGPYLGDGGNPLEVPDYFHTVGRDDLADYYRRGTALKLVFNLTGALLLAGGIGTGVSSIFTTQSGRCQEQDGYGLCIKRDMSTFYGMLAGGIGAAAVGIAALIVAGVTKRFKTGDRENYRLAADHNRKLRKELGLPPKKDEDVPEEVQRETSASLSVLPLVSAQGGGLSLSLTF